MFFIGVRLPNAEDLIRGMDWVLWRSWSTFWLRRIRSLSHEWAPAAKQIKKSQLLINEYLRMQLFPLSPTDNKGEKIGNK